MRLARLSNLLALGASLVTTSWQQQQQWPLHDNGLNQVVQWDHHSFMVNGERLFLWSGELHLWRLPVPDLWEDILQKLKAAGFNTIAIYEHWGWHAPNNETLDFSSGAHDFTPIFEIAARVGVYIVYRPGPYSNAEANGGGFPGWLTTGEYGPLRDDDPRYTGAWTRYWSHVADIVRPHLITNGGPVLLWQLENEYGVQFLDPELKTPNRSAINYMETLDNTTRGWNIDVPFTANNPNMWTRSWSKDYSDVGGEVDLYGLDHYPACWSCNLDECTNVNGAPEPFTVFNYYDHFQSVSWTQPSFLMEFQGGSYNPWNGPTGGCIENMAAPWVNLFFRHNLAQKVSAVNIYMAYGGTNWGNIGYPNVGTSYDYSAPVQENRMISDKFQETKLFGLFTRIARDFTKVDRVGNSTDYSTNPAVFVTELRNPDNGAAFYVTRHDYSPSTDSTRFRLNIKTSIGDLVVPEFGSITLNGTESKVLVSDFRIGGSGKVLAYSTIELLTIADFQERQVVVLWAPNGQNGEFLLKGATTVNASQGSIDNQAAKPDGLVVSFTTGHDPIVLDFDIGVQAVIVDRESAYKLWAPTLGNSPFAWENETVIVTGPYLVRHVELDSGKLNIYGDWNQETSIEVWAPPEVQSITFNGEGLDATKSPYGTFIAKLAAAEFTVERVQASIPALHWKAADALPEAAAEYDDSRWTAADHMSTPHFVPPDTYPVLFADEYGYQAGNILWRGRFDYSPDENLSAVYLRVIGGAGFGWSTYLNGEFLGSYLGDPKEKAGNLTLNFENHTLNTDRENVVFVIQDTMGKEQREGALDPRGILNATLITQSGAPKNFTSWKVSGNAGGNHLLDPIKGTYNEGGLHAERLGWHLPGFDDSAWQIGNPNEGFIGATARFYRTNVTLSIPRGHDASMAFELVPTTRAKLRAQLYVNGYQYGKIIPVFGNQVEFPVPPGILNYSGDNTIGLSIWAMDVAGGAVDVQLKVLGVYRSSYDVLFDASELHPVWTDRSQYA
ncbi:putative beta-galactosidase [Pyrenochaeta sp. DS3sAY3a]|nr:putative beta-galactosidase [Pyrenochaeta sp. DS3sAY3a]